MKLLTILRTGRGLRPYAAVVLGFMVLVILEGAVVRATGSGAGCGNRWPLCNGEVLPHHPRLATVIEFTHRSLTGICSTLFAGLFTWVFLAWPSGSAPRRAVCWAAFFLLTEALLGAVLVKGGYVENNTSNARVLVQCIHFTNTMVLLATLTLTRWTLRPSRKDSDGFRFEGPGLQPRRRSAEREGVSAPEGLAQAISPFLSRNFIWLALLATIVIGATGSVAALADTLFPSPNLHAAVAQDLSSAAPLLVRMRVLHPASAVLGFACVACLCWRIRTRAGHLTALLLAAQFVLGIADVLLLAPLWLQVLHLLTADLYWIALVALAADLLAANALRTANVPELALTA